MTKTKTIEISELIQKANDLHCSLSLNFAIGEDTESGSFIADFLPLDDQLHPIKSTWGYWSEVHQFSGGTTVRLFKPELELKIDADWLRDKINDEEPEICDAGLMFPDRPINPLTGCNGITEADFFYTPPKINALSDEDETTLDLIVAEIEEQHGVDGRKAANEMIEHEKKNDNFEAYDRAKKDLEE